MANPDGSVIIDTKINTDGVDDGSKEIKKKMSQTADAAEGCADQIEDAFKNLDVSDGFKEQTAQIDAILSDTEASAKSKAAKIASVYKKAGDDQKTAFEKAWKAVKAASEDGSEKVKDDLDGISEKAKQAGQEINTGLGGIGKILGKAVVGVATVATLKESAEALADFGKEALQVGSDLQEVQNVVDVTFTTMSDKVNEFAKSADASAGLSETMAKEYAGTFGTMAKSMGFAEAEAYELATALTQFTGDLASFRNLSQDEAFTKLQAIFTGETESLKSLGVVMTQTNLDAFALANGFGKTTDAMTEQEKVSLRYQYVMDQLSAAQGDFVRTQDSWANQTKTLELQMENLKTTVGEGLIGVLSPLVGLINDAVVPALQDMATKFAEAVDPTPAEEFQGSINRLKDTMSDVDTEFTAAIAEIERTSFAVDACVESMKELEASGLDTAEAQNQYAAAVEYLNGLLPDLNAQIDKNTGLIDKNTQEIYKNLDAMKQQVKYKAYQKLLESHEAAINDLAAAEAELYKTQWERQGLEQQLQETYGYSLEQIHELGMGVLEMNVAMDGGIGSADDMALAFGKVDKSVFGLTPELQEMLLDVVDLTSQEKGLNTAIAEMNATLAESDPMLKAFMEDVMGISDAAGEATDNLEGMTGSVVAGTSGALSGTSDIVAGVMDELSMETDRTYGELTQGLENNADVIRQHAENLAALMSSGAPDSLISQFTNSNSATMAALNEAMQASNGQFTELIGNFNEYERATQELQQTIDEWKYQQQVEALTQKNEYAEAIAKQREDELAFWEKGIIPGTEILSASEIAMRNVMRYEEEARDLYVKALEANEQGRTAEANALMQEYEKLMKLVAQSRKEAGLVYADVAQTKNQVDQQVAEMHGAITESAGAAVDAVGEVGEAVDAVTGAAVDISDGVHEILTETSDAAEETAEKVTGAAEDTAENVVKEAENAANEIEKKSDDFLDEIFGKTMDYAMNTFAEIQDRIDKLEGKTVYVDVVSRQYPTTYTDGYTLPTGIPYLAEGAVIPPNAPFMAVLGDQRHGTNIEAPADLIRQIVQEEMESIELGVDVNFSGDLAPLISLLTPKITAEQRRNSRAGGY